MKTVRDACALQPNALSITLGDQVEQLDELISAEGNGAAFFEKTQDEFKMLKLFDGDGVQLPNFRKKQPKFLQINRGSCRFSFEMRVIDQHGRHVAQNFREPIGWNFFTP